MFGPFSLIYSHKITTGFTVTC